MPPFVKACEKPLLNGHTAQYPVLHAVLSLDCGGLEQLVVQLCLNNTSERQHAAVLCLNKPGVLSDALTGKGVQVYCLHKPAGLHVLSTRRSLNALLRDIRPKLIHTHQLGALLHFSISAPRLGIPLLHTEHGKHFDHSVKRRWLARVAARAASRFVCVSEDIASSVKQWRIAPQNKIVVIPNGVDIQRFQACQARTEVRSTLGIPSNAFVVGTVGRLAEVKQQHLLLRSFQLLRLSQNAHLIIVGDGPEHQSLKRLAQELRIDKHTHFAGYRADSEKFLSAMDVFALTSRSEGMPLAVLEAWSAGVCVVASRVGGIPELIEEGRNGLMFPAGDYKSLGRCLTSLVTDPQLRSRIALCGFQAVHARFSLSHMAERYQAVYQELVGG